MQEEYKNMLHYVMNYGYESSPRDLNIKEILNFSLKVDDILNCGFEYPSRQFNYKYLCGEIAWYLSGNLNATNIGEFASLWKRISDNFGNVRSNYGYLVFKKQIDSVDKGTQYNWALKSLIKDKDTRQAIIRYNHDGVQVENCKDFICTLNQQFFIRQNELIGITNMRSNDLFYGFSYDVVWFSLVQQSLRLDLLEQYPELELGEMYFNVGSAHIYESMFEKASQIIKEEGTDLNIVLKKSLKEQFYNDIDTENAYFGYLKQQETKEDYKNYLEKLFNIEIQNAK